ncbi:MAG: amino acid adenylation domain-containing protein, partial [Jatrophihabitantaceae bacterium]
PAERAEQLSFDWGTELGNELGRFCAATATSPASVLIAACQILLYRHGDQPQVAVGVQIERREDPAVANLVGPLAGLIVIPTVLAADRSFGELACEVDQLRQQAIEHAPLPFSALVRALGPERAPGRLPLCDLIVTVADRPPAELRIADATTRRLDLQPGAISSDLSLQVSQVGGCLAGNLRYRSDLFEPAIAASMLDQLRTLLLAGLRAPGTELGALPLDSPQRAQALAAIADQLSAAVPAEHPVHELVRLRALHQPEHPAIISGDRSISYRQLDAAAAAIAARLGELTGLAGAAVAVRMAPGAEQVAASLGALRAGAHLVWFGLAEAGERSRTVLADLMPRCLLVTGDSSQDELVSWYRDGLNGSVLELTGLELSAQDTDVQDTGGPGISARDFQQLARWVYIAYTSGSTGTPKAVAQTHGAFAQFVTWMADEFDIGPGARVAQWAAPEHDPSICEVFATLVGGGTLYPVPDRIRAHPERLLAWLAEHQITFLQTVPSFARELRKVIVSTDSADRLASLNRLLLMGESLTGELANGLRDALPSVALANVYGPTETIAATWQQLEQPAPATVPVGRTIPGRQVLVLDQADRPCPIGVTGQIVIRSPSVTPGYVGANPGDLTAFLPVAGLAEDGRIGSYRTGDLGRWRPDGTLEFRGRLDFQVKLYGTRIELTDIEAALAEHESVAECAVSAVRDRDGLVTRLVGYVLPRQPGAGSVEQWRSHLRRRLGTAVLPAAFVVMDDRLPRNLAGKVDRRRLPPASLRPDQDIRQPASWIETDLARIWTELLGVEPAHVDQDFFAAGGYSLLVLKLRNRVRARFGVDIPLWDYFATPSLAAISAMIANAIGDANRHHAGPADREHHSVPARAF